MSFEISLPIDAPADLVWAALVDVERWPDSTASISSVERLDHGPFQLGSSARIKQPRLTPFVWTVTDIEPGRAFTWCTTSMGVTTIADHRLTPHPAGGVVVTLGIRRTGLLAPLIDALFGNLTRRYVTMEIEGLKRTCEARAAAAAA